MSLDPGGSVVPPPTAVPVTGGGKGPPVDSFAASIPGAPVAEQQANIAVQNAATGQAAASGAQQAATVGTAEAAEAGAAAAVPPAVDYAAAVKQAESEFAPKLKRAGDDYDAAQARASGFKYEDHWANQSFGTKVLAAISSFLGGLATGNPVNRAQEWIDRDYKMQQDEAARLLDIAKMRGADQNHLVELQAAVMKNLNTAYLGKIEAVKRQVDAEAAKKGTEMARANADKMKADLDAAAAAKKLDDAKQLHVQVVTHSWKQVQKLLPPGSTRTVPATGQKFWRDPSTGLWEEFLKPAAAPVPAQPPVQPGVAPAPPPAQPGLSGAMR